MKKHLWQLTFLVALHTLTVPLLAAGVRRSFSSPQPVGNAVQQMLDALAARGIAFEIQKVYDAKTEGKHGIVLKLKSRGTMATILFVEKGTGSIFHLQTEDYGDSNLLGRIFLSDLKMAEIGLGPDKADPGTGWPVTGLKDK